MIPTDFWQQVYEWMGFHETLLSCLFGALIVGPCALFGLWLFRRTVREEEMESVSDKSLYIWRS